LRPCNPGRRPHSRVETHVVGEMGIIRWSSVYTANHTLEVRRWTGDYVDSLTHAERSIESRWVWICYKMRCPQQTSCRRFATVREAAVLSVSGSLTKVGCQRHRVPLQTLASATFMSFATTQFASAASDLPRFPAMHSVLSSSNSIYREGMNTCCRSYLPPTSPCKSFFANQVTPRYSDRQCEYVRG
jgi:hypothetical protein